MKKKTQAKAGSAPKGRAGLETKEILEKLARLTRTAPTVETVGELKALAWRQPTNGAVHALLLNHAQELGDLLSFQVACEALVELSPEDAELAFVLPHVYVRNQHLALAVLALRVALERFPDHEKAPEARDTLARLEAALPQFLASLLLDGEDAFELAVLHEEVQARLEAGDLSRSRTAAIELLERRPTYRAALNNLSQFDFIEGKFDDALSRTRALLEREPGNIHARAALVRLLCVSGFFEEAHREAERFAGIEPRQLDHRVVMAEAWSQLGDDERVLEVFAQIEARETLDPQRGKSVALAYHFAAVAEARGGEDGRARELWAKALEVRSGQQLIQANLDDLDLPPGERHGPWPLPLANWLRPASFERIYRLFSSLRRRGEKAGRRAVRRLLVDQPELVELVPVLLDRGDPQGRLMAYGLARTAWTPEMIDALRGLVSSRRGPDGLRLEAAGLLHREGVISSESTPMWIAGERRASAPHGDVLALDPEQPGDQQLRATRSSR